MIITQTTIDTNDYRPQTLAASKLDETGMEFVYKGIHEHETKFGVGKNCFVIDIVANGNENQMIFSSKKLATAFMKNESVLSGKKIRLRGFGVGVERSYKIDILE